MTVGDPSTEDELLRDVALIEARLRLKRAELHRAEADVLLLEAQAADAEIGAITGSPRPGLLDPLRIRRGLEEARASRSVLAAECDALHEVLQRRRDDLTLVRDDVAALARQRRLGAISAHFEALSAEIVTTFSTLTDVALQWTALRAELVTLGSPKRPNGRLITAAAAALHEALRTGGCQPASREDVAAWELPINPLSKG